MRPPAAAHGGSNSAGSGGGSRVIILVSNAGELPVAGLVSPKGLVRPERLVATSFDSAENNGCCCGGGGGGGDMAEAVVVEVVSLRASMMRQRARYSSSVGGVEVSMLRGRFDRFPLAQGSEVLLKGVIRLSWGNFGEFSASRTILLMIAAKFTKIL